MAVAGDGEVEHAVRVCGGERRRAEGKQAAHLRAGERERADLLCGHAPALVAHRLTQPTRCVLRQHTVGIRLQQGGAEIVRGDLCGGDVVRHVVRRLRRGDGHQIRQCAAPERGAVLGRTGGGGVEDGADGRAVIDEILPVRVRDGGADTRQIPVCVAAPLFSQRFLRRPRAAAGRIAADVRVRVLVRAVRGAVGDVGARGDGLRAQRLRLEGGGHLGGEHAGQPFRHRDGDGLAVAQHGQQGLIVGEKRRAGLRRGRLLRLEVHRQPRDAQRQNDQRERQEKDSPHEASSFHLRVDVRWN